MNLGHLLPTFAILAGGIDEGQSSPNNGAGIAGFVLLLAWIAVFVVQVLRRRRRAAMTVDDATEEEAFSCPACAAFHVTTSS